LGVEVSEMAPAMAMAALEVLEESALALEESALVLAHHHCTTAQGRWRRRFRCRSRSLLPTGGTNRCCRRRSHRNLPRICSNLRRRVAPAQVRVARDQARDHRWR